MRHYSSERQPLETALLHVVPFGEPGWFASMPYRTWDKGGGYEWGKMVACGEAKPKPNKLEDKPVDKPVDKPDGLLYMLQSVWNHLDGAARRRFCRQARRCRLTSG